MPNKVDYHSRFRKEMENLNSQRGKKGGSRYAPPNGLYSVTLVGFDFKDIVSKKTRKNAFRITPRFKVNSVVEIVQEDLEDENFDPTTLVGKEFDGNMVTNEGKRAWTIDDIFILAQAIDGEPAEEFADACVTCQEEADNEQSALIEVRVTRDVSDDGSKVWPKTFINGAFESDEDEDGDDADDGEEDDDS